MREEGSRNRISPRANDGEGYAHNEDAQDRPPGIAKLRAVDSGKRAGRENDRGSQSESAPHKRIEHAAKKYLLQQGREGQAKCRQKVSAGGIVKVLVHG